MKVIVMKQEDCLFCKGSGYIVPYPYRRQVKCDHSWSVETFKNMRASNMTKLVALQAEKERIDKAWETGKIKDR